MLEIKKHKTEFGYSFQFATEDGIFCIFFAGNLDTYWNYQYCGSILDIEDSK